MKTITNAKYTLTKPFKVAQKAILVGFIILAIGRWYSVVDSYFVLFNAEIHSHISNFILSGVFYVAIGSAWLMYGVKFRFIAILGVFLIATNIECETLMGFMNTTDIVDAIYGAAGVAAAFAFLLPTHQYGLRAIPDENRGEDEV